MNEPEQLTSKDITQFVENIEKLTAVMSAMRAYTLSLVQLNEAIAKLDKPKSMNVNVEMLEEVENK
jgi:hypothetical protein